MIKHRRNTEKNLLTDRILAEIKRQKLEKTPYCVQCGSRNNLQLGHVFSRVCKSIIFEWDNLHIQCESCNNYHEVNPEPFNNWAKRNIGIEKFNYLEAKSKQIKKWTVPELKEKLKRLRCVDERNKRNVETIQGRYAG